MKKNLIIAGMLALSICSRAQTPTSLTTKDYQNAENFLSYRTESLISRNNIRPNWTSGDKLWYAVTSEKGTEFYVVDPVKKTKSPAFDNSKLSEALSKAGARKSSELQSAVQ